MWEAVKNWFDRTLARLAVKFCSVRAVETAYKETGYFPDFWHADDLRSGANVRESIPNKHLVNFMEDFFAKQVSKTIEDMEEEMYNRGMLDISAYPSDNEEEDED